MAALETSMVKQLRAAHDEMQRDDTAGPEQKLTASLREIDASMKNDELQAIIAEANADTLQVEKASRVELVKSSAGKAVAEVSMPQILELEQAWGALQENDVNETGLLQICSQAATAFLVYATKELAKDGDFDEELLKSFANTAKLMTEIGEDPPTDPHWTWPRGKAKPSFWNCSRNHALTFWKRLRVPLQKWHGYIVIAFSEDQALVCAQKDQGLLPERD